MILNLEVGRVRIGAAATVSLLPGKAERERERQEQADRLRQFFAKTPENGPESPAKAPNGPAEGNPTGYVVRAPQGGMYL